MNVNIPSPARDHFWEEPPPGHQEFWSFRFRPPCEVGETLYFRFDKRVVATATVDRIEAPGKSSCATTGRFSTGWKVFWEPETFIDKRNTKDRLDAIADMIAKA